jgi:hypothetical protein
MANPYFVNLKSNSWMRVARGVTAGIIKRVSLDDLPIIETYRVYGDPKPTSQGDGVHCFLNGNTETIASSSPIDVYLMCIGFNTTVRVDLQ